MTCSRFDNWDELRGDNEEIINTVYKSRNISDHWTQYKEHAVQMCLVYLDQDPIKTKLFI